MKVIAILDRSAGNETVGEMWQETAIFDESTPVGKILDWATLRWSGFVGVADFRGNLKITVGQEPGDE